MLLVAETRKRRGKAHCQAARLAEAEGQLSRAATLGSEHAAISIARRLDAGSGVQKDMDAARFWFNLSKTCKNHDSCETYVKERDIQAVKVNILARTEPFPIPYSAT